MANFPSDGGDRELVQWLSPLDSRKRHQDMSNDRFDGVGNWLLETSEFQEWRSPGWDVKKGVFFCSGNPGVGKTFLRYHKCPILWKNLELH